MAGQNLKQKVEVFLFGCNDYNCYKMFSFKTIRCLFSIILLGGILICGSEAKAQSYTLLFEDQKAIYIVHLPVSYNKTKKYPLVLNFAGLGAGAKKHEEYCRMDEVADKKEFIVVYPQSYHKGWNTGLGFRRYEHGKDDLVYVNTLLDTLIKKYSVNTQRIYSVGVSLGGSFSYSLACEMSNRIAAVASVSGLMTDSALVYCNPTRDMPVLHFHGTHDHIMRYTGMHQARGVEQLIKLWVLRNHCANKPDTIHIPDRCKSDKSTMDLIKYSDCETGAEVWFYKVYKGGHTWPGSAKQFKMLMGRKNKDINGSEAIWEFFEKFTLQTGVAPYQPQVKK